MQVVLLALTRVSKTSIDRLRYAVGFAQYEQLWQLLENSDWRATLLNYGAPQEEIDLLERFLQSHELLPYFTPAQAVSLLGVDDQAERIASAICALPLEPEDGLRLFLAALDEPAHPSLIARIDASENWKPAKLRGAQIFLHGKTWEDLKFSPQAVSALALLNIHSLNDARERTPTPSELLKVKGCGRKTLREIVEKLREVDIIVEPGTSS